MVMPSEHDTEVSRGISPSEAEMAEIHDRIRRAWEYIYLKPLLEYLRHEHRDKTSP